MGLKCSLFGHAFDERDVVRERESKGSEVVTVARDVERCTECGATRVVSTNKEVVSTAGATADGGVESSPTLQPPGDGDSAGDGTGGPGTADAFDATDQLDARTGPGDAPGAGTGAAAAESDADGVGGLVDRSDASAEGDASHDVTPTPDTGDDEGVELMTDDEGDAAAGQADVDLDPEPAASGAADPGGVEPEADTEDAPDPETEDAEILTDEPEPDRAPGQWPGDDTGDAWEPEPLTDDDTEPDPEADDATDSEADSDATDADTDEASAEILDGTDDRDAGETPDTAAEPAPDIEPEPAATASFTVPDGHYRCPECGHTIPAESSFRRGDACPECIEGYLEAGE